MSTEPAVIVSTKPAVMAVMAVIKEAKKANNAILIDVSLIAAVRLNREAIKRSAAVSSRIADCIRLAEMIPARLRR